MVTINYKDGRPFYEQVKEDLRRLVVSGALRPGDEREDENDRRRAELLARLSETVKELRWLGMSAEEIAAKIGGMQNERD